MLKDLREYFNQMQLDYNKVSKIAEKVNKEIEEGLVTQEQRDNFEAYFNSVKANYDRVSYIMHLVSLPPKFIQKIQEKQLQKKYIKQMEEFKKKQADLEAVHNENEENIEKAEELFSSINSEGE